MPHIEQRIAINSTPDEVWRVVGDPGRIGEWHPALSAAVLHEDERTCTTADGATIRERVIEHADDERYYTYEIVEAPLPVSSYRSTIAVHGHGDHSHVSWVADFVVADPATEADVASALAEMYRQGLESLRSRFDKSR